MKIENFTRRSLIAGVYVLNQALQDELLKQLRKQQLSYLGALILVAVYVERKDSPVGPSRISRALKFSRSRVSQEISRLEKQGLLKRSIASSDSRSFALQLTPEGEKAALKVVKSFEVVQDKIDKVLGEKRAEKLNADLLTAVGIF